MAARTLVVCLVALSCMGARGGERQSMHMTCFAVLSKFPPRPHRLSAACGHAVRRASRGPPTMARGWLEVRGVKSSEDSRLLAIAQELQVKPPLLAPKWLWKLAWETFRVLVRVLHAWDPLAAWDNKFNLSVLWWKAIAGNTRGSHVADGGMAYDMLPSFSRWVVRWPICLLFPRLHHQNVAMRTSFLSRECDVVLRENQGTRTRTRTRTRVVVVGAGFDTRVFGMQGIEEVVEVDLPEVMEMKRRMLETRLFRRRPSLRRLPYSSIGVDLNDVGRFQQLLEDQLGRELRTSSQLHTLFVFEAVLAYLDEGVAEKLLAACRRVGLKYSQSVSLCLADRLPLTRGEDREEAARLLGSLGFELRAWMPKPGIARHMASARAVGGDGKE